MMLKKRKNNAILLLWILIILQLSFVCNYSGIGLSGNVKVWAHTNVCGKLS